MTRRGNNEGTLARVGNRWIGRVTIGYDAKGRAKRRAVSGRTRAEAAAKLTAAIDGLNRGAAPMDGRTTVGEYLSRWLEESCRPSVRPSTYKAYSVNCRIHIIPAIGGIKLAKLAPTDVRRFLNAKLQSGLSARSVQFIRANLHSAIRQAMADGLVARNVVDLVKGPSVVRPEVRPLSPEQVRVLLEGVKDDRNGPLYTCAVALGLRQGELVGLAWEEVDLKARTVRIVQTYARGQFGAPKTDRSRRVLCLPDIAVEALVARRERQNLERAFAGPRWKESGLVFSTSLGTPMDGRNLNRYLQRHLARLGLPKGRFHDLRHACASLLLAQNVSARVVMEQLGHSQIAVTMNLYSHVIPALLTEAATRMDTVLRPPTVPHHDDPLVTMPTADP